MRVIRSIAICCVQPTACEWVTCAWAAGMDCTIGNPKAAWILYKRGNAAKTPFRVGKSSVSCFWEAAGGAQAGLQRALLIASRRDCSHQIFASTHVVSTTHRTLKFHDSIHWEAFVDACDQDHCDMLRAAHCMRMGNMCMGSWHGLHHWESQNRMNFV